MTLFPNDTRIETAEQHGHASVPDGASLPLGDSSAMNRRRFLEAAGFSLSIAAVSGCSRAPIETALPPIAQPEWLIPGQMQYYASTCGGCPAACGLLVGTRDGRPLKMEGMPEHPLSRGGLCAVGQALPISLYDNLRLTGPLRAGKPATWAAVDSDIQQTLEQIKTEERAVRFVTPTLTSPTLQSSIDRFLSQFKDAKHVVFDPISSSAILDAHEQTHSVRVLPHYRFDLAEEVVSFGADFLGTWISPVEFTAGWRKLRVPEENAPKMSHHVQLESRVSLTGSNADKRYAIRPQEQSQLVARLVEKVAAMANATPKSSLAAPLADAKEQMLAELAERLWNARSKSLVVCDSQDVGVQRLINYTNHLLGNYGSTLDLNRPSRQRQGNDREVEQLMEDLQAERIGAIFVADLDLLHDLPNQKALADAVGRVPLKVSFAPREDEFASLANFVCPDHHVLESWSDAEPVRGMVSLVQPTLQPLSETRAIVESLGAWSGQPTKVYDALRSHWEQSIFPQRAKTAPAKFTDFWQRALHDGFVELDSEPSNSEEFKTEAIEPVAVEKAADGFALLLYAKVGMLNSQHSHNPWLQELPDPVTKVTWDNYVCFSPRDAEELGLKDGDVVAVAQGDNGPRLELPAFIQVGQADGVLAIALGYGCKGTDRFAKIGPQWLEARPTVSENGLVGKNAAGFLNFREGTLRYMQPDIALKKTDRRHTLASTQGYNSLELPPSVAPYGAERREIIQHTTLAAFAKDAHAGAPEHHHDAENQLWPEDHPKTGHAWGMVIDLNKCTGCSACVIACQSENNVPVVGRDEICRQREMHWLRIDRYYAGEGEELSVAHQPMMCQHCDNAPCETVCPVLATVHSSGGLNEQIYNRCVGTRYCANNCPYKVRRFNWFEYAHNDTLQNLMLNPDVTVRSRGVMEKCSMCVQRIEAGKVEARSLGQPLADGAVQTACQQSCPAEAILFGDMNDPESRIHAALENPRRYRVLEELNARPSVSYLRVVKNRDEEARRG